MNKDGKRKMSILGFWPPILVNGPAEILKFWGLFPSSFFTFGPWPFSTKFCMGARWALAHLSWKENLGYTFEVYCCIWCISDPFWTFETCILFKLPILALPPVFSGLLRVFCTCIVFILYRCINCVYQCIRATFRACIYSLLLNFTSIRNSCMLNLCSHVLHSSMYQCIQVVYRPVLQLSKAKK